MSSDPAWARRSPSSASTLESLRAKICEDIVAVAQRDRSRPESMPVRLQQEHKVLVVEPGDPSNGQAGTATLMEKGIETIASLIRTGPIDYAITAPVSFAYRPQPVLDLKADQ